MVTRPLAHLQALSTRLPSISARSSRCACTIADPVAGPGQVLVAVKACSVNYPDVLIIEDKYQFKPERPFAPGAEIAGVIESISMGVTGWNVGELRRLVAA